MIKSETSQVWVNAGYEMFARDGPDGVQIERLARIVDRNKSGFYHHFGDRDLFFLDLIRHHHQIIDRFCSEISLLKRFNPDYLELLVKYKTATLIQMQLRRHMSNPVFGETFTKVRKKTEKELLPLLSSYLKIYNNNELVLELWHNLRDLFFMRVTWNTMTLDFLCKLVDDYSQVIEKVKRTTYVLDASSLARIRQTILPK